MYRIALPFFTFAALALLAGCTQGTAAQVQTPPRVIPTYASVAPLVESASDTPVRIPEGRKSTPASTRPAASQAKAKNDGESDVVVPVSLKEQGSKQERSKQEKTNSRRWSFGNAKGDSRSQDKGDSRQRMDKAQEAYKQYAVKKESAQEQGSGAVQNPTATPPAQPDKGESAQATSPATSESTTASSSAASSAQTGNTASSTTFPVTYGSAHAGSSRSFKKPTMPGNLPSWFTDNDKDGDGQLSMNEWPGDKFEEFTKYDKNHDAIITIEEALKTVPKAVASAPAAATTAPAGTSSSSTPPAASTSTPPATTAPAQPRPGMMFTMGTPAAPGAPLSDDDAKRRVDSTFMFVDANKDNILDTQEIENTRTIRNVDWKKYDANKDGKLDRTEATALFKAEGNSMRGGGGMGGMAGRSPDEMSKMMFDNMDRAKTGKISKENFPGFWRERFAEFDTNKDGFVDLEEFKANREKVMPQGGRRGPGGPGGDGGNRGFGGDGGNRGFGGQGGGPGRGGDGGGRNNFNRGGFGGAGR